MAESAAPAENPISTISLDDPNFATICSFIEKFGETCHIGLIPFKELQFMIENTNEVSPILAQIHIKLLRRVYKSINADKWEKHLAKFCHSYNSQDAWELERFGYKKSKIQTKLRLLKNLLEAQFDYNTKFKNEVNKLPAESLRLVPMGRDSEGQAYWYQVDTEGNLRIYREDAEDDTWELVATNREQMVTLIQQLESGIVTRNILLDDNEEPSPKESQTPENEEIPPPNGLIEPHEPKIETSKDEEIMEKPSLKQMVVNEPEIPKITETLPKDILEDDDESPEPMQIVEEARVPEIEESSLSDEVDDETEVCETEDSSLKIADSLEPEVSENEDLLPQADVCSQPEPESLSNADIKTNVTKPHDTENLTIEESSPSDMIIDESKLSETAESDCNDLTVEDEAKTPENVSSSSMEAAKHTILHDPCDDTIENKHLDIVQNLSKPIVSSETVTADNNVSHILKVTTTVDDSDSDSTKLEPSLIKEKLSDCLESDLTESLKETNPSVTIIKSKVENSDPQTVSPETESSIGRTESETDKLNNIQVKPEQEELLITQSPILSDPVELTPLKPVQSSVEVKCEQVNVENSGDSANSVNLDEAKPVDPNPLPHLSEPKTPIETESEPLVQRSDAVNLNCESDIKVESKQEAISVDEPILTKSPVWVPGDNYPKSESDIKIESKQEAIPVDESIITKSTVWVTGGSESDIKVESKQESIPVDESIITKSTVWVTGDKEPKSESVIKEENIQESIPVDEPIITKSSAWVTGETDAKEELIEKSVENTPQQPTNQGDNSKIETFKQDIKSTSSCLVGYDSSSDDGDKSDSETVVKRKTESPRSSPSPHKIPKLSPVPESGPIVGEAIEEAVMIVTGQGTGAECEGGVDTEVEVPVKGRGSGGRRGRPRGGSSSTGGRTRKRSSSGSFSGSAPATVRNGRVSTERPTRQSSRIAKIQEREEEERRKQEEERLAQLKEAQIRKQQKMLEKETKTSPGKSKTKISKSSGGTESKYLPTPSATDFSSEDEADEVGKSKKKRGRKKKYDGAPKTLMKKGLNPWVHSSSEEAEDDAVEEEEEYHEDYHVEEEDLTLRSDHEFSPESDLGEEDDEAQPSRHARTAKRDEAQAVDKYATTNCEKCSKGDHPEWILLCDSCDKGCHASCVRPQLWVIPEGQWFCQPCQHKMLIEKMNQSLTEYDQILKKHENEVLRKERLAYVGISLNNVLPQESETFEIHKQSKKKKKRRHISSEDEEGDELMENSRLRKDRRFIDSEEDESNISTYSSKRSGEDEDEDEPIYKLRARRTKKAFNFQEYDEMINSALKEDDEVPMEEDEPPLLEPQLNQNGGNLTIPEPPVSKGKVMPDDDSENEENVVPPKASEPETSDEEELDEKEKKRRKELQKSQRKTRRRLNDLDATDDDDSDEDFKESELEDDEDDEGENEVDDEDSEWSGDREADESDDSLARQGKAGKYGRKDKYLEVGSVRRSTRKARRKKVVYDESDQEDEDDEAPGSWNEESGSEESESNSESDQDATWGKKKKKKGGFNPSTKPKGNTQFFMGSIVKTKTKYGSSKKKKKKVDDDEEDKPWNRSKKVSSESLGKRSTRGKKINFKDILESGESDDDGNIVPKRRRVQISSSEDSDHEAPSSSKKLMAEINASKNTNTSTEETEDKKEPPSLLEEELMNKPVPAPPLPPSIKKQLLEAEHSPSPAAPEITVPPITIPTPPPPTLPPAPAPQMSTNLMMSEILASTPSKKQNNSASSRRSTPSPANPHSQPLPPHPMPIIRPPPVTTTAAIPIRGLSSPPHQPSNSGLMGPKVSPSEISRVPNPAYFPPNSGMRFPWIRPGSGPPYGPPITSSGTGLPYAPPTTSPGTGSVPLSPNPRSPSGKPPPLNSSPPYHVSQRPPTSSPYPTPPPLRIPNPNVSSPSTPLQSFQQFKRDAQLLYRLQQPSGPTNPGPPPRVPPGILPHLPHPVGHDRFFSPHTLYGIPSPYGIPPHTQAQPIFNPGLGPPPQAFDFRPDEPAQVATTRPSSPRQTAPTTVKEENSDGEFGGLVSYFSSQRGEEDMDT